MRITSVEPRAGTWLGGFTSHLILPQSHWTQIQRSKSSIWENNGVDTTPKMLSDITSGLVYHKKKCDDVSMEDDTRFYLSSCREGLVVTEEITALDFYVSTYL